MDDGGKKEEGRRRIFPVKPSARAIDADGRCRASRNDCPRRVLSHQFPRVLKLEWQVGFFQYKVIIDL